VELWKYLKLCFRVERVPVRTTQRERERRSGSVEGWFIRGQGDAKVAHKTKKIWQISLVL
jgi:hypothetical protein